MNETKKLSATSVRIPDDLLVYLKHQAVDSRRSLNSEILMRLEASKRLDDNRNSEKQ